MHHFLCVFIISFDSLINTILINSDSSKDFLRKTKPLQTIKESFHSNDVKSRLKHEVSNDDDDFR